MGAASRLQQERGAEFADEAGLVGERPSGLGAAKLGFNIDNGCDTAQLANERNETQNEPLKERAARLQTRGARAKGDSSI